MRAEKIMPDWSYQNVFKPLLFRLPPARARDLTLGAMGRLARTALGRGLIEFMGHMAPPPSGGVNVLDWSLPSRVVIGAGLDARHLGSVALARFGVGVIELGAVTQNGEVGADDVRRVPSDEALEYPHGFGSVSLEDLRARVARGSVKCLIRIGWAALSSQRLASSALESGADGFTVMPPSSADGRLSVSLETWCDHLRALSAHTSKPVLALVPITLPDDQLGCFVDAARDTGIRGFALLEGRPSASGWRVAADDLETALRCVRAIRARSDLPIIAAGGVTCPRDALELLEAGANLVSLHTGLVYSGPGLPKRINAAVAERCSSQSPVREPPTVFWRAARDSGWLWLFLLGCGMMFSGCLVALVGITRATLPYDEDFLGVTAVCKLIEIGAF
jgi:dihydroorotate dehydrogenase